MDLAYTPTTPWIWIIPQPFFTLRHPEPYVCGTASQLLSRLAEDALHLITFPAVVQSDSGATGTILHSTSLARMPVIGYIIGLGDRHSDNVFIVHLSTAQVSLEMNGFQFQRIEKN